MGSKEVAWPCQHRADVRRHGAPVLPAAHPWTKAHTLRALGPSQAKTGCWQGGLAQGTCPRGASPGCCLTGLIVPTCFLFLHHRHTHLVLLGSSTWALALRAQIRVGTLLLCSCGEGLGRAKAQGCYSLVESAETPSAASWVLHVPVLPVPTSKDFREAAATVSKKPP